MNKQTISFFLNVAEFSNEEIKLFSFQKTLYLKKVNRFTIFKLISFVNHHFPSSAV